MLGVFSNEIAKPPEELVIAGNRTPSPKKSALAFMKHFKESNPSSVCIHIGDQVHLSYTQHDSPLLPRLFGAKEEIFCMFEEALNNLGSLRQEYGLAKSANEVVLLIEAYKALRDRAPYPPNRLLRQFMGNFAFIVFDRSTSSLFVASDQFGRAPLYWGIIADGFVAFAENAELLRDACGKSLAPFPPGCFFTTAIGELRSYGNSKNKITAIPAADKEICGTTFKVEEAVVPAATDS